MNLVSNWSIQHPILYFLFNPVLQWLRQEVVDPPPICSSKSGSCASQIEELINSILICVQLVASRCPRNGEKDESTKYLLDGYLLTRDLSHLMRLDIIKDKLSSTFSVISSYSDVKEALSTVIPFLDLYLSLALDQISALATWTKALFKFNFVLCSLLRSLCQQGFCRPTEMDEEAGPTDTPDVTGGTGIGSGLGAESISKEIQEESQIEGLQETAEDSQRENEADPDAIETTEDFGGELEDISEVDDDIGSSEDESEFDETLENLNAHDPSITNEKMRDNSQPPGDSDGRDGMMDESHSIKQPESSKTMSQENRDLKKPEEGTHVDGMKEEMELQDEPNNDSFVDGTPMEQVPDADTLDLPDDINLDDKEESEGDDGVPEDCEFGEDQSADLPEDMVNEDMDDKPSLGSGSDDANDLDDKTPGKPEAGDANYGENEIQDAIPKHPDIPSGGEKEDSIDDIGSEARVSGSSGDSGKSQNENNDKLSTQEKEDEDAKCEYRPIYDYKLLILPQIIGCIRGPTAVECFFRT